MDRISALRNVEDAIREFEDGDADLETTEREVLAVLRTYATEFETEERRPYRAHGGDADGTVVVAASAGDAADRVSALTGVDADEFEVDPI